MLTLMLCWRLAAGPISLVTGAGLNRDSSTFHFSSPNHKSWQLVNREMEVLLPHPLLKPWPGFFQWNPGILYPVLSLSSSIYRSDLSKYMWNPWFFTPPDPSQNSSVPSRPLCFPSSPLSLSHLFQALYSSLSFLNPEARHDTWTGSVVPSAGDRWCYPSLYFPLAGG